MHSGLAASFVTPSPK
jgi:hypothetical protein